MGRLEKSRRLSTCTTIDFLVSNNAPRLVFTTHRHVGKSPWLILLLRSLIEIAWQQIKTRVHHHSKNKTNLPLHPPNPGSCQAPVMSKITPNIAPFRGMSLIPGPGSCRVFVDITSRYCKNHSFVSSTDSNNHYCSRLHLCYD